MNEIEIINGGAASPILLLCDHAGHQVPDHFNRLGISLEQLKRHIGWDIGAADMTRRMASRLGATAILNHHSRLIIDPNRRPYSPTSIPPISDGCVVPANQNLFLDEVKSRISGFFLPYHRAVARQIGTMRREGRVPALIAVHSFTHRLNGENRPWQIGVLWRGDQRLSAPALERLREQEDLVVGDNQPYTGLYELGYTMAFHAQRTGLPHIMLEVRQDEIDRKSKAEEYADLIAAVLEPSLEQKALYTPLELNNKNLSGMRSSWRQASLASPLV